jgi:hypothetical protein
MKMAEEVKPEFNSRSLIASKGFFYYLNFNFVLYFKYSHNGVIE